LPVDTSTTETSSLVAESEARGSGECLETRAVVMPPAVLGDMPQECAGGARDTPA